MLRRSVLYVADMARSAADGAQNQIVSDVDGTLVYATFLFGVPTIVLAVFGINQLKKRHLVLAATLLAIASVLCIIVTLFAAVPLLVAAILAVVDKARGVDRS